MKNIRDDIEFSFEIDGLKMKFKSTWGIFSPKGIDTGTKLLLEHLEIEEDDNTLDIGCGYGPIGIFCAKSAPDGEVHMVDKDFVAVDYAKKNINLNGLGNCQAYLSNGFSNVPREVEFDNVISNIPAKVGKEMLSILLEDTYNRLKKGGRIYVVVVVGLKDYIKRNFKEVFGNYKKLKQGKTHVVAMAVKE